MADKTPSRQLRWDDKAESDLLMAVILNGRDMTEFKSGLGWDGIHAQMVRWGRDFGNQHFSKKILRGYKNRTQDAGATPASVSPKKRPQAPAANDPANADEGQPTPTKKGRRAKKEQDGADGQSAAGGARKRARKAPAPTPLTEGPPESTEQSSESPMAASEVEA